MKDLISVVVPIYNVERFFPKCIDSIIFQSYKELQIILVDDGSTDNCGNICDEYALKDSRIEVVHKSNGGLSDARNVGISMAKGKYITFVDSDDVLQREYIYYLYNLLTRSKADISVCQKRNINEAGEFYDVVKRKVAEAYVVKGNSRCMHDFLTESNIGVTAWGKLYRIELFHCISYPVGRYHEDLFTTYKIIGLCEVIAVGFECKYYYRQRRESIMSQSFSLKHMDAIRARLEQIKYVKRYYPDEIENVYSSVVYTVNQCAFRMEISCCYNEECIETLESLSRKYLFYFLKMKRASILSKCFSIMVYLNLPLLVRTLSVYSKLFMKIGKHS